MRSQITLVGVVLLLALFSGCKQGTSPAGGNVVGPSTSTMTCFGYTFVFEREGDGASGVEGHRSSTRFADSKETGLDEDITITCGTEKARIVNGKLSAKDMDRGTVKPGDTIKVHSSGKLWVNGVER